MRRSRLCFAWIRSACVLQITLLSSPKKDFLLETDWQDCCRSTCLIRLWMGLLEWQESSCTILQPDCARECMMRLLWDDIGSQTDLRFSTCLSWSQCSQSSKPAVRQRQMRNGSYGDSLNARYFRSSHLLFNRVRAFIHSPEHFDPDQSRKRDT